MVASFIPDDPFFVALHRTRVFNERGGSMTEGIHVIKRTPTQLKPIE